MGLTFRCEDASWTSLSTYESRFTVGMPCRSQSYFKGVAKFAHVSLISSSSEEVSTLTRAYLNNQKVFCHASKESSVYLCQSHRTVRSGVVNFWRWVFGFCCQSVGCHIWHPFFIMVMGYHNKWKSTDIPVLYPVGTIVSAGAVLSPAGKWTQSEIGIYIRTTWRRSSHSPTHSPLSLSS